MSTGPRLPPLASRNPIGAIRRAAIALFAGLLLGAPASLRAQHDQRPPAERIFAVRQLAYWLPVGWDLSRVCAAETLLVAALPQAAHLRAPEFDLYLGPDGDPRPDPVRRTVRAAGIRVGPVVNERDSTFGYPDPSRFLELGSLATESGLWIGARPRAVRRAWLDTVRLEVALDDDSVAVREIRRERRTGSVTVAGTRWAVVEADVRTTVTSAVRVEQHTEDGGVRAAASLRGLAHERYLYDPASGLTDSLASDGRLEGRIVYSHRSGRADTLIGTWVFRRRGAWRSSGAAEAAAQFEYFVAHGRYPEGPAFERFGPTGQELNRALLDPDSLRAARTRAVGPFERFSTETALRAALAGRHPLPAWILDARPVRAHDALLTGVLVNGYRYPRLDTLDLGWAESMADLLADEHLQRELVLDRDDLLAGVLSALEDVKRVARTAEPTLADAARRASDPLGRDLLLLAAYMADPAAGRPLIRHFADSVEGYGPVARRYAAGDAEILFASWGLRRDDSILKVHRGRPFPGLDADPSAHSAYLDAMTGYSHSPGGGLPAVEQWFAARGLDARAEFRRRFAAGGTESDRLVWAEYLMQLGDRSPLAWLRDTVTAHEGTLGGKAIGLLQLAPEPVADSATASELQELALSYAMGGELPDTAGRTIERFTAHDERPGKWYLLSDSLMPAVRERWRGRLRLISTDSLAALAQREGLQMALDVGRPVRVGRFLEIEVALLPFTRRGEMCLCGGGSHLTLERRNGRWMVVSSGSWIS